MVDVIYSVAVSLDGFVARRDLDFDWLGPFMASGDDYVGVFIDSMGALLVGSHTYAESEQTLEWFGQSSSVELKSAAVGSSDVGHGENVCS